MKKGWKIFWIVCAVCLGIGFVCCAVSLTMGVTKQAIENRFPNGFGWVLTKGYDDDDFDDGLDDIDDDFDFDDDDDDDYDDWDIDDNEEYIDKSDETDTIDSGGKSMIIEGNKQMSVGNVGSIDADIWGAIVKIKTLPEDSKEIAVKVQDIDKKLKLRCYMDGNELKIKTAKKVVGIRKKKTGKIYIYVPEGYKFDEVSVNLEAGYLHVEDIGAEEFSVDVGAGEGKIDNFTVQKADFECGAGSLTAEGTAGKKIDMECGIGEIIYTAPGSQNDYNYELECGIGEIVCGESTYSGVGVDKEINNHAGKQINIECGIGNVTVKFSEL